MSSVASYYDQQPQREWERWVELNERLGREPTLYGAADHLLYVGCTPAARE